MTHIHYKFLDGVVMWIAEGLGESVDELEGGPIEDSDRTLVNEDQEKMGFVWYFLNHLHSRAGETSLSLLESYGVIGLKLYGQEG